MNWRGLVSDFSETIRDKIEGISEYLDEIWKHLEAEGYLPGSGYSFLCYCEIMSDNAEEKDKLGDILSQILCDIWAE